MMEFGKSLKAAREAKGLTVAQLVEATHLAPTTIVELENEDFSHIAAPIYGRGFVKLYCEAVGLDPKPFVTEFMEIFSGNHDTEIRERPVSPAAAEEQPIETVPDEPSPVAAFPDEDIPVEASSPAVDSTTTGGTEPPAAKPVYTTDSLFASDPLFAPEPEPPSRRAAPPAAPLQRPVTPLTPPPTSTTPPPADEHAFSKYAAPIRQWKPVIPTSAWRIGILALGALALLILLVLGIRALYLATSVTPNGSEVPEQEPPTQAESSAPAKPTAEPARNAAKAERPAAVAEKTNGVKTERKPQPLPALYVD